MNDQKEAVTNSIWYIPIYQWALIAFTGLVLAIIFYDGLVLMVKQWESSEEYGYGYLIPVLTLFFVWQRKDELERLSFPGAWAGLVLLVMGALLYVVGEFSTLFIVVQYAFLLTLYGAVLALVGWRAFRLIWVPLLFLVFMIPLPNFLYQGLSGQLQLISSELGVFFIRLFGISVYLEGNVIDLGSYKLQVVEACSGLRYLFPLTSLAFIAAYIYKAAFWKRALVFLSSIPITIIMNSFRIGMIGVLVEYWGSEQAEGFLHYFEGWVIFMACMSILILEMWVLSKIGRDKLPLRDAFALELPSPSPADVARRNRALPYPFIAAVAVLVVTAVVATTIEERQEVVPDRASFAEFPLEIASWEGRPDRIEDIYLEVLKLDDYVIADYENPGKARVNFYAAYYGSQRKGASVHSPRSCIPGGGWEIDDITQRTLENVRINGTPLSVNRTVIKRGDDTQLVYYWFQQRGRVMTNEYLVKWFLFWDSLTRNRSDGALVRLTAFVAPGEDIQEADRSLTTFAQDVSSVLESYIPN